MQGLGDIVKQFSTSIKQFEINDFKEICKTCRHQDPRAITRACANCVITKVCLNEEHLANTLYYYTK